MRIGDTRSRRGPSCHIAGAYSWQLTLANRMWLLSAWSFLLLAAGCGARSGIEKIVLEGQVTVDGKLVPNGEIRFYPVESTQGPVSGAPIVPGRYVAESRGGVPVGKHRVEIRAYRASKTSKVDAEGGPAVQYLPPKYNDISEIALTVTKLDRSADFNLDSK